MRQTRAAVVCAFMAALLMGAYWHIGPAVGTEAPAPAAAQSQPDETRAEREKLFDAVVETIEKKFFDRASLERHDWRTRAASVRPSVLSAATAQDAVRQINALLSELEASHTGLVTPDDYNYYILLDIIRPSLDANGNDLMSTRFWGSGSYYPGTGAFTLEVDHRHFVDGILEGSPADRAGLKYGDEIISVDGMPYSPIAAFRGKIGATVRLTIRRAAEAAPERLQVPVVVIRPTAAFAAATLASARVIEKNGRRVGYIHIWSSIESESFKTALTKLDPGSATERTRMVFPDGHVESVPPDGKPLDFLIVDMRGRVGGNAGVGGQILEALDAGQKPYWGDWRAVDLFDRGRFREATRQRPPFRGRSALLIDHHTRSAAEIMAYGFKRSAFGPVVGTRTAGAVLSGATFVMPGDLLLYVAVGGHSFDGQPLEGVGVAPDARVERPLPYAAGADPVLDAAVELLAGQASR